MVSNIFKSNVSSTFYASMVKWTAPEPYIGFNESDSKLCTNFEFYEGKNHNILRML